MFKAIVRKTVIPCVQIQAPPPNYIIIKIINCTVYMAKGPARYSFFNTRCYSEKSCLVCIFVLNVSENCIEFNINNSTLFLLVRKQKNNKNTVDKSDLLVIISVTTLNHTKQI